MATTLEEHAGYLTDRIKLARYQEAISHAVQSGHTVMDLGCGSGILGLLALRAGADNVIFVEETDVLEIARRSITDAGYADKASFLRTNSFELAATDPVDVIVCDHVGYFGFDYGLLALLADAKKRFLKPGGIVIPERLTVQLSLVESGECRKRITQWQDGSVPAEFRWVDAIAANTKHAVDLEADNLLDGPEILDELTLGEPAEEFLSWSTGFVCARDATVDGLAGSFSATLVDEIRMSNSPLLDDRLNRPQAFLPLQHPVAVTAGEKVDATVMCRHKDHLIAWIVNFPRQDLTFSYNTFNSILLDNARLSQTQPTRVAALNDRGIARKAVLSYCDGKRTVAEIHNLVRKEHPELFPTAEATTAFVDQVLAWNTDH